MSSEKNLRLFRLITEDEKFTKPLSPFKYGISKNCAKRIFNTFSVNLINTDIYRHITPQTAFFKIKTIYCQNDKTETYNLTVKTKKYANLRETKTFLKEYYYLKLIFHILFNKKFH